MTEDVMREPARLVTMSRAKYLHMTNLSYNIISLVPYYSTM